LWKIFGVNDESIAIDVEIDARKVGFLYKLSNCKNKLIQFKFLLYNIKGKYELELILTKFQMLFI